MGINHTSEIDKIISEMTNIIDLIKENENKINKSIEYRIQGIYHDFWITKVPNKKLLSEFYYSVGLSYQLLSGDENKKKALEFLVQAEDVADKLMDFEKLYNVYNEMGMALYMLKKYERSYYYHKKAYQLGVKNQMGNNKISASLVNLSTLDTEKGEYENAINYLKIALKLIDDESIQEFEDETKWFMGMLHSNLALNYIQLFEYEKSLEHYKNGLKFFKNPENFRKKLEDRIKFIIKDIEDETEIKSLKDLIIKIKHIA